MARTVQLGLGLLLAAACAAAMVEGTAGASPLAMTKVLRSVASGQPTAAPASSRAEARTASPIPAVSASPAARTHRSPAPVPTAASSAPARPMTQPSSTPPAPSSTPPAPSSTPPVASSTAPVPTRTFRLGGATFTLQRGWQVYNALNETVFGTSDQVVGRWCLAYRSDPAEDCQFLFEQLQAPSAGDTFDPDVLGAGVVDPRDGCSGESTKITEKIGTAQLGNRTAEWRQQREVCWLDNTFVQYVVPTAPAYLLWDGNAHPGDPRAAELLAGIVLPAATGSTRYADRGKVRRIVATSAGKRITLERYVKKASGSWVDEHATATYVVPTALFGSTVKVGTPVYVETDGQRVIRFTRD